MKHNALYLIFIFLGVFILGCDKAEPYDEPEILETSVSVKGVSSVEFRVSTNFTGNRKLEVEVSQDQSFTNSERYTMIQDGVDHASLTVIDLKFGVKYYYRIIASNSYFTIESEPKSFKIGAGYYYYGNGKPENRWGYTNTSFTLEWAVMLPPSKLAPFTNSSITKVRTYVGEPGNYTLNLYIGGSTSPSTLLLSKNFKANSSGWQEISISSGLLDVNSSLWISIKTTQTADHYPASYGKGINYVNSRMVCCNEGDWLDGMYWGNKDFCWLIQAYVKSNSKGENDLEMEIPLMPWDDELQTAQTTCCVQDLGNP